MDCPSMLRSWTARALGRECFISLLQTLAETCRYKSDIRKAQQLALDNIDYEFDLSFEVQIETFSTQDSGRSCFVVHHSINARFMECSLRDYAKEQKLYPWVAIATQVPVSSFTFHLLFSCTLDWQLQQFSAWKQHRDHYLQSYHCLSWLVNLSIFTACSACRPTAPGFTNSATIAGKIKVQGNGTDSYFIAQFQRPGLSFSST